MRQLDLIRAAALTLALSALFAACESSDDTMDNDAGTDVTTGTGSGATDTFEPSTESNPSTASFFETEPSDTGTGSDTLDTTSGPDTAGVVGRIDVLREGWGETWNDVMSVAAAFRDQPVRMGAFQPFPVDNQVVSLAEGACVLLVAAELACNPPCGFDHFCGAGNVCKPAVLYVTAGDVTVTGPQGSVTLTGTDYGYTSESLGSGNLGPSSSIEAVAAGGDIEAFQLSSFGVDEPSFDVSGSLVLEDGKDNVISWTPAASGTVQVLLNHGWHGSDPKATLICEADASTGTLIIPRAIVEAYPQTYAMGLFQHPSYISLIERERVSTNLGIVELAVGYRQGITPEHNQE